MRSIICSAVFGLLFAASLPVGAEVKNFPSESKISQVTLYRSQALTIRDVTVPDETGELALLIENLPPSVVPGSLFASSKDLKVRSVRYLTELPPRKLPDDKIDLMENKINDLNVAKGVVAAKLNLLQTKKSYLESVQKQYIDKLGPSESTLPDKGVKKVAGFDFDTIARMTEFVFKQQDEITRESLALADETRKIEISIKETQQQLDALRHGAVPPVARQQQASMPDPNIIRKAMIYVAKLKAGKSNLALGYLVNNAGWNPAYNMRISGKGDKLNLEYLAHVRQLSGEDWNGVTLTLSTATPNMNAELPILAPMWIHLIRAAKENSSIKACEDMAPAKPVTSNPLAENAKVQMGTLSKYRQEAGGNTAGYNFELNTGAWNQQNLEFRNTKEVLRRWSEGVRKIEQQMAVEYKIPDTVTLASRNDNQMVQILSEALDCSLYYEAVPLLSSYISRGVEAKNTINQPLLAGEYSAFIDGQYVGAGQVPVTATGQTLILGFGIDPQLRCRRELVDKIADKSWGSRTELYKYCLILDNYKPVPVDVRLFDRIPVSKDKGLEISLKEGKDNLSQDADYRESDLPKGILRWDITLPASSSGAKAVKFDYSFDMKFDSDMQISGLVEQVKEQLRDDLTELRMKKQRK